MSKDRRAAERESRILAEEAQRAAADRAIVAAGGSVRVNSLAPGARRLLLGVSIPMVLVGTVLLIAGAVSMISKGSVSTREQGLPMAAFGLGFVLLGLFEIHLARCAVRVGPREVVVRTWRTRRRIARQDVLGILADGAATPLLFYRSEPLDRGAERSLVLSEFNPNSGGAPAFARYRDDSTVRLLELLGEYVPADPHVGGPGRRIAFARAGLSSDFVFPPGIVDVRGNPAGAAQLHDSVLQRCSLGHPLFAQDFTVLALAGDTVVARIGAQLVVLRPQPTLEDPGTVPSIRYVADPQELLAELRPR